MVGGGHDKENCMKYSAIFPSKIYFKYLRHQIWKHDMEVTNHDRPLHIDALLTFTLRTLG